MSSAYKLVMNFLDGDGKTISYSLSNAKMEPTAEKVKTALDAFITNGSILKNVPVSKKSAYLVKTDQTEFAIE